MATGFTGRKWYRHRQSGDLYAGEFKDGSLTATAGPFPYAPVTRWHLAKLEMTPGGVLPLLELRSYSFHTGAATDPSEDFEEVAAAMRSLAEAAAAKR